MAINRCYKLNFSQNNSELVYKICYIIFLTPMLTNRTFLSRCLRRFLIFPATVWVRKLSVVAFLDWDRVRYISPICAISGLKLIAAKQSHICAFCGLRSSLRKSSLIGVLRWSLTQQQGSCGEISAAQHLGSCGGEKCDSMTVI